MTERNYLQLATKLAADILDDHGITEPPVPSGLIHSFDASRPIRVFNEELRSGVRGATMLDPDGGGWVVVLNKNDSEPRRRFTLFHEAYHIACGTGIAFRKDNMGAFFECSLAEHFASHFLIPNAWLDRHRDLSPRSIARRCLVTVTAAQIALNRNRTIEL